MIVKYLSDPAKWPKLAERLRVAGEFGYDTETYGQEYKESPQHRARVHCWSVGVLTSEKSPFGYRKAAGVVLPRAALDCDDIRGVFADASIRKWAHNSPHDYHSTVNEGLEVNGLQDTLQWARIAFPGMTGYGLKQISQWALKHPQRPNFKSMVTYEKMVTTSKCKVERGCVCDSPEGKKCRKRVGEAITPWGVWSPHIKVTWKRFVTSSKLKEFKYDVRDFTEDNAANLAPLVWNNHEHDRWLYWLEYSAEDAIQCIEFVDYIRATVHKQSRKNYPWP